ncbi:ankyrin repeat-containing protein BDA1-like isoform X1 [Vicia villosa]|uniref:ankyrin repeat-containing protein BDA1-like isoform X1 n=1 Tax=Vicia villosa TaxID=3911 RepID=UPI00273B1E3D|nr:ankyrin repeat-containing protein BDA1-like isoform X1 [Vicia villosa]
MNTKNGDQLKISAETGDIKLLYAAIQDDPSILENIDKNQFVDTPLHIAASRGHLEFATEIMNLKPSFAAKLNLQGHNPIHLAMNNLQSAMVSKLVGINKDLVRVKGREGLTPLHIACQNGEVDLLAKFLTACPDSIEDVTVRGESALHIAVKNDQYEALHVLVGWLKENFRRGARKLQNKIYNHKDDAGNTALHISALTSEPKVLQFLVKKTGIKLNAKNLESKTALDLVTTPEKKKILICAKAKSGSKNTKAVTLAEQLIFLATIIDIRTWMRRIKTDITEEQRNTWLIVATLVATVTYESALSPPGGIFQVSASDDNNMKVTITDDFFSTRGNAGKSILTKDSFMLFSLMNMFSFCVSIIAILVLTPGGAVARLVIAPVSLFLGCFLIAMPAISPTRENTTILSIPMYSIVLLMIVYLIFMTYDPLKIMKFRYKSSRTQPAADRTAVPRVSTI